MTKFYLHNAARSTPATGSLPSTEQSTLTADQNLDAQANNHSMNTTVGVSQATFSITLSTNANINYFIGKWVSDLTINQSSIAANTWTWDFAVKQTDAGTNADFPTDNATFTKTYVNLYVWRPSTSTVVGKVLDGLTGTTYSFATNSEATEAGTFTGSAVNGIQANDVLVFEAWADQSNGTTTNNTLTFYFDGTTDPTSSTGTAIASAASFLSTPENISLIAETGTAVHARSMSLVSTMKFTPTTASTGVMG